MSLLIKNATIVNADKKYSKMKDILIDKGIIEKIASKIKNTNNVKEIDATGKLVLPGLIDLHAHFREPGREDKETIETGSMAAAKGGFTTVMCMPNTTPVIDNCMIVEAVLKEAKRVGLINVIPIGSITKGQKDQELSDIMELKKAGCLAISDDGKSVFNAKLIRLALQYSEMAGMLVIEHCQDPDLFGDGVMNEGETSTLLGLKGDPAVSETAIIARDIEIVRYLNARLHLAHISLKRSVEIIRLAKKDGVRITAEVCPHHFTLTEEAVKGFDTNTKVNPALRLQEDVDALKQALKDGTIDCVSTDHAPHTVEEKELDFDHAPFGMIGLETALGLAISELVDKKILTWSNLVEKMSSNPAKIIGLDKKGEIKEGFDADIVIVDSDQAWEVRADDFVSKSKNSPFIGKTLKGCVEVTICGGTVSYRFKE